MNASERSEESGAHSRYNKNPPGTIAQKGLEIISQILRVFRMHHLLGHQKTDDKKEEAYRGNHHHSPLPPAGGAQSEQFLEKGAERIPERKGYEGTGIGEKHPVCGIDGLLLRIVGDYSQHCGIRDIDHGIYRHHHHIREACPQQFTRIAEIGSGEEQNAAHRERSREP